MGIATLPLPHHLNHGSL